MSKQGFRYVGKPVVIPDGPSDMHLRPVLLDNGEVRIEWSAVDEYGQAMVSWRKYRRRKKGKFATTQEAREFIRAFAKAEQERFQHAAQQSNGQGSGTAP
jgi:hypothetical protein